MRKATRAERLILILPSHQMQTKAMAKAVTWLEIWARVVGVDVP
jgi:hypothetical protein